MCNTQSRRAARMNSKNLYCKWIVMLKYIMAHDGPLIFIIFIFWLIHLNGITGYNSLLSTTLINQLLTQSRGNYPCQSHSPVLQCMVGSPTEESVPCSDYKRSCRRHWRWWRLCACKWSWWQPCASLHPVAQLDLSIDLLSQQFAPRVLGVELGRSEVASNNMNTNPFSSFLPKKPSSELCSRCHILFVPSVLLFTQMLLEVLSQSLSPVFRKSRPP